MRWDAREGDITQFIGEHRWLSNFYPVQVSMDGLTYPTVEHAYQAAKTLDQGARLAIRDCPYPGQAKRLGGTLQIRDDWFSEKIEVMRRLLQQKFSPGSELAKSLLETGSRLLIEGNTWGDRFWGVDSRTSRGENHLGVLLMSIREGLRD